MGRHSRLKPFPAPAPLFPITGQPTGPLDLIPVVADPTARGARAWEILRKLPITEGEHAGKRIGGNSPPWQERLTKLIFGHTDELGRRVLREVFACVAKKNSKTSFAAALSVTKLLMNEEQREHAVCLAANRLQARIAFDAVAAMIRADDELARRFEIVEHRNAIKYAATQSRLTAIAADMAAVVGLNPSFAIVDELHLLGATPKGAKLVSQIRTANVARKEPLLISISTAPVERSEGIFEATMAKARRVIAGEEIDPRFFAWLCEIPRGLDPEDPDNWGWSNPSLGYTITRDRLIAAYESARSDPMAIRDFRSQNLNISPDETAGIDRWLPPAVWDAAADDTLTPEALIEESDCIYAGTDAGGLDDLSAVALLGKKGDRFQLWIHQWLSKRGYEKRKSVNAYDEFVAAGELTLFEGGGQDLLAIADAIRLADNSGKLALIGIDAYGATDLAGILSDCSAEVQSVPQGWRLTPAISWVDRRLADGALKHNGSRLMRWNMGNAVLTRQGNALSINKATVVGAGKIDGVAAMLNAAAAYLANPDGNTLSENDIRFI